MAQSAQTRSRMPSASSTWASSTISGGSRRTTFSAAGTVSRPCAVDLAESLPGFVWRHETVDDDAEAKQIFDEPKMIFNMSVWKSKEDFDAWTQSENFRKAHANARAPEGTYLGHPNFEGFEVVL